MIVVVVAAVLPPEIGTAKFDFPAGFGASAIFSFNLFL